ncbi:hypothetical protein [Burkholderia ambifaria]|uniref:hypothetical protein n=1 Tax=Burkholderia ambifaria TaxID=152480 RepID=UPI001FC7D2AB|nr:hypothetical protein [Burkholderia ambifaria]
MFEVLEQPVLRPLEGHKFGGKTVEEVARYLEQALQAAGLEPEWVIVAQPIEVRERGRFWTKAVVQVAGRR